MCHGESRARDVVGEGLSTFTAYAPEGGDIPEEGKFPFCFFRRRGRGKVPGEGTFLTGKGDISPERRRGEVSPCGASDFANSGKVTKAPFGNQGFQNLPLSPPWFSRRLPARQIGTPLRPAPLPLTWRLWLASVLDRCAPGRCWLGSVHARKPGRRIRRGWKFDLPVRRRPLPLCVLDVERSPSCLLVNAPGLCPGGAGCGTAYAGEPVPWAPREGAVPARGCCWGLPAGCARISLRLPSPRPNRPHHLPPAGGRLTLGPSGSTSFVGAPRSSRPGAHSSREMSVSISRSAAKRRGKEHSPHLTRRRKKVAPRRRYKVPGRTPKEEQTSHRGKLTIPHVRQK